MAKSLFKKCPSCKFAKCWVQAPKCEECGYDFKLGRKPRSRSIEIDDDDIADIPPVVQVPPVQTTKPCPDCGFKCWHAAPICEKCEYNFKTGESRRQKIEAVGEEKKEEMRVSVGVVPYWPGLLATFKPHPAWLDDFKGGDEHAIRTWATNFLRELRQLLSPHTIYQGCVTTWAQCYTKNEHLHKIVPQLEEWYASTGIVTWRPDLKDQRIMRGERLTTIETAQAYRQIYDEIAKNIAVHMPNRICMLPKEEADKYREEQRKAGHLYVFVSNGSGHSLRPLPDNWQTISNHDRAMLVYEMCGAPEDLPSVGKQPRVAPDRKVKKKS